MVIAAGAERLPAASAALIVLDGWGLAPDGPGNAVSLAHTPVFDELWASYPHTPHKVAISIGGGEPKTIESSES